MMYFRFLLSSILVFSFLRFAEAVEVSITDAAGNEIPGSEAAVVLKSGAYQKGRKDGARFIFEPFEGQAKIYLAAPGFESDAHSLSVGDRKTFILKASANRNSKIVYGRSRLEDKGGDINPILDSLNRLYIYGIGIGLLDGSKPANQPLYFKMRSPISAEDSTGKPFKIYVMEISPSVSLVEYTK